MVRKLLRLSRPLYVLLTALTYLFGVGIARYLGVSHLDAPFWLGLWGVLLAQTSMSLLVEIFRPINEPIVPDESRQDRRAVRDAALYITMAALTALAVIAYLLYHDGHLSQPALLFLGLSLVIILIYSVPPFRLVNRGYGELLLAVHIAYIVPAIAFLLQTGYYHRLLSATTVPLTLIAIASFLTLSFRSYSDDIKYERRTLVTRLGWERAVPLHHFIVLFAYFLFGCAPLFGFSIGLLWRAFLTFPFAALQIYWLRNISLGAKPLWALLSTNAITLIGLTAYTLTMTFWLR